MATKATTLWSLGIVKGHLKVTVTDRDDTITKIADRVSALIEQKTRRVFVTRQVVELRNGEGQRDLLLRHFPVSVFTQLRTRNHPSDAFAIEDVDDYVVDKDRGLVRFAAVRKWPTGLQTIEATYTPGHDAQDGTNLPADIVGVGLDMVKLIWDEHQSGATAASSISIGPGNFFIKPDWPMHIKDTLQARTRETGGTVI